MLVRMYVCLVTAALCLSTSAIAAETQGPIRAEVEEMMGLPSDGDLVRGQLDTLGFVVGQPAAEEVVAAAVQLEQDSLAEQDGRLAMAPGDGFVGGICPHDDHLYASRVYVHLTERITAPRVLLIGVFHKARLWDLKDRIVFDSFEAWHAPWEPIRVDPLREELIAALPEDLPPAAMESIFAGAAAKVREAGGTLAGGHTIRDPEPKYGLAVVGAAHPDRLFRKGGA